MDNNTIKIPIGTSIGSHEIRICNSGVYFVSYGCGYPCPYPCDPSSLCAQVLCAKETINVSSSIPPIINDPTIPAPVGSVFTINGTNFVPGCTTMTIDGVPVELIEVTTTSITFNVPDKDTGLYPITVTTPAGTSLSNLYIEKP